MIAFALAAAGIIGLGAYLRWTAAPVHAAYLIGKRAAGAAAGKVCLPRCGVCGAAGTALTAGGPDGGWRCADRRACAAGATRPVQP